MSSFCYPFHCQPTLYVQYNVLFSNTDHLWQVLGGVVDKVIQLDESSVPVIQDTLAILTSKEIKLSSLRRYIVLPTML